ncbi:MAG: hypothetical protein ACI36X_03115 [Bacteroidaceae bacterium]
MKKYLMMMLAVAAMAGTVLFSACDNDDDPKKDNPEEEGGDPQQPSTGKSAFTYYFVTTQTTQDLIQMSVDLTCNNGEKVTLDLAKAEKLTYEQLNDADKVFLKATYQTTQEKGVTDMLVYKQTFSEQSKPATLTAVSNFQLKEGVVLDQEKYNLMISPIVSFGSTGSGTTHLLIGVKKDKVETYLQSRMASTSKTYSFE